MEFYGHTVLLEHFQDEQKYVCKPNETDPRGEKEGGQKTNASRAESHGDVAQA